MKKRYDINIIVNDDTVVEGQLTGDAFKHEYIGHWMCSTDNYGMNESERKNLNLDFKPPENFTVQDKTLYRFPKLDLPRQKVDLLKDKYNCKVIRDINKADIHIVSDQLFDNLFEFEWNAAKPFAKYFSFVTELKAKGLLSQCALEKNREMIAILGTDSMVKVKMPYQYSHNNNYQGGFSAKTSTFKDDIQDVLNLKMESAVHSGTRDILLYDKNLISYQNVLNSSAVIVYDVDVINIIDNELAILNNSELKNIHSMVTSNDRENRTLALEMLANCNIDKSFDVVSNLFYWQYDWLKDTSNWNTVNVKALRKRLKKYQGGVNLSMIYSYDNYIKNLIKDKKLTKFALDNTRERLYKNVLRDIGGNNANVFSISLDNVKLKDNLTDNLIKEKADEYEVRYKESNYSDNITV